MPNVLQFLCSVRIFVKFELLFSYLTKFVARLFVLNYCANLSIIKNVAGSILIFLLYFRVIGRAAFTGKHRWLFSDAHDSISSFESQDIFQVFLLLLLQLLTTLSMRTLFSSIYAKFPFILQDDSDFGRQFSSGIKVPFLLKKNI
jgi:hypothetical protein